MVKVAYRYKNGYPEIELCKDGFPRVYCPPGQYNYEKLSWLRFGSGGECDARHCFVDDWRIEHLWRRPGQGLAKAMLQGVMTAPDYSVEKGFPHPLAIYQIWRSSVIMKYWQENGVHVVPVLQWGDDSTWKMPASIIQQGSVVAVRGPQRGSEKEYCIAAEKIQSFLRPAIVLHFGRKVDVWDNPIYLKLNSKK